MPRSGAGLERRHRRRGGIITERCLGLFAERSLRWVAGRWLGLSIDGGVSRRVDVQFQPVHAPPAPARLLHPHRSRTGLGLAGVARRCAGTDLAVDGAAPAGRLRRSAGHPGVVGAGRAGLAAARGLRPPPRLVWLSLALVGTIAATALRDGVGGLPTLPPLLVGLMAVIAVACALLAFLPSDTAAAPVLGLAVLALPLLSSLQFYAGYPLRVMTAEVSRWLLQPAFDVLRDGSSLWVDGRQVIVDAPCSGVQMVWLGYFTACVVAAIRWPQAAGAAGRATLAGGLSDRLFLTRLPLVGAIVLAGNIVRNSVLVGCEGAGAPLAPWAHQALGLFLLSLVCGAIAWWMARAPAADAETMLAAPVENPLPQGHRHAHPA